MNLVYLGILFYFFVFMPESRHFTLGSLTIYGVVWACGILWYFGWRRHGRTVGVDVSMTYGELPPE